MPLPHFGINEPVRVCQPCVKTIRSGGVREEKKQAPIKKKPVVYDEPTPVVQAKSNCTCGMPLCICPPEPESDDEDEDDSPSQQPEQEKPKPVAKPKPSPTKKASPFFMSSSSSKTKWDLTCGKNKLGEQCRDAVKYKDLDGVKSLLAAKADPCYQDNTGNTLMHLAAMFDCRAIVKLLHSNGASVWTKNPSGETPCNLAPVSLGCDMESMEPKP